MRTVGKYGAPYTVFTCQYCGKQFSFPTSTIKQYEKQGRVKKYCSKECAFKARRENAKKV